MSKHLFPQCLLETLTFAIVISLWCASVSHAPAQSAQPENKQTDSVRGIVVNSVTREPVGRALVFSNDNRYATMTDGEGRFEFTFPPEQTADNKEAASESAGVASTVNNRRPNRPEMLMARKPGFLGERNGPPTWRSPIAGKELTIELTPEALIVGRVALPTSEPSDTIQLEIYRRHVQNGRAHWSRASSASTRASGEFRFAELSAGSYKLLTRELMDRDPVTFDPRGQQYGYPPIYFPNATDFTAAQTIQLAAGQVFQANISLVKHPYYPIKVAVTNVPPGVAGLSIVVSPMGHRSPGFALGYNNEDQMILGTLPDGNYSLEASSYAPNPASGLLNISVRGSAVEGVRMTLVPNGAIGVNVKEEFTSSEESSSQGVIISNGQTREPMREPRRYLNVYLEPADDFGNGGGSSFRRPSGPEDDSLAIDGVQPGRYWVRTNSSRGFVAAISSGTTDLQHHPLVVGLGGSGAPIEITVRDSAAEIDGTVEGVALTPSASENADPRLQGDTSSPHVYCIPLPDSSGEFREVWVPPDGKFGPQEMPPGTYRVLAFDRPQPELEYHNPEAMRAYDAKGQVVRLVAGQKEHLHLQLISSVEQP